MSKNKEIIPYDFINDDQGRNLYLNISFSKSQNPFNFKIIFNALQTVVSSDTLLVTTNLRNVKSIQLFQAILPRYLIDIEPNNRKLYPNLTASVKISADSLSSYNNKYIIGKTDNSSFIGFNQNNIINPISNINNDIFNNDNTNFYYGELIINNFDTIDYFSKLKSPSNITIKFNDTSLLITFYLFHNNIVYFIPNDFTPFTFSNGTINNLPIYQGKLEFISNENINLYILFNNTPIYLNDKVKIVVGKDFYLKKKIGSNPDFSVNFPNLNLTTTKINVDNNFDLFYKYNTDNFKVDLYDATDDTHFFLNDINIINDNNVIKLSSDLIDFQNFFTQSIFIFNYNSNLYFYKINQIISSNQVSIEPIFDTLIDIININETFFFYYNYVNGNDLSNEKFIVLSSDLPNNRDISINIPSNNNSTNLSPLFYLFPTNITTSSIIINNSNFIELNRNKIENITLQFQYSNQINITNDFYQDVDPSKFYSINNPKNQVQITLRFVF